MFWDPDEQDNNNDGVPFSYLHAWEQKGSGGTYQKGMCKVPNACQGEGIEQPFREDFSGSC